VSARRRSRPHDGVPVRRWPNLRASVAVFKFERGEVPDAA
jgi:hypothetical protein